MKLSSLDLNLLLVLHTVLEERSVTRAARRLHVTPPAVSNALARLRGLLDDPLLVRTGRQLTPTPLALELAPSLQEALGGLERALTREAKFDPATAVRSFTLACSDSDQLSLVPDLAKVFAKRMPRSTLHVVSIDQLQAAGGLESPEVDVAIAPAMARSASPGVHAEPLYQDEPVLVVRRGHPAARRKMTRELFNSLRHVDLRIVLGQRGVGNRMIEEVLARHGLKRDIAVTVPSFSAAVMLAVSTDLVAGVTRRVARTLAPPLKLQLLELPVKGLGLPMELQWHERTHHDPANRFFRELVIDVARR